MPSSTLIRWGGLAAVVAGLLFLVDSLINLFVLLAGRDPSTVVASAVVGQIAGAVLLFGLVGLYFRRSEELGIAGLIGFLLAFFCTAYTLAGNVWANLLAELGWALFGIACLQARVYPRAAAILLVVGALLSAVFLALLLGQLRGVLGYLAVAASIVFDVAVVWLGFNLFMGRSEERSPVRRVL
ncbi:MAG TPA: hypothetical protein VE288_17560 [Rubrobacteraceae bacterium]|jgi:hypothetical protein|nr:hypothetical protein [Rubrobacteraceae bacterium]